MEEVDNNLTTATPANSPVLITKENHTNLTIQYQNSTNNSDDLVHQAHYLLFQLSKLLEDGQTEAVLNSSNSLTSNDNDAPHLALNTVGNIIFIDDEQANNATFKG